MVNSPNDNGAIANKKKQSRSKILLIVLFVLLNVGIIAYTAVKEFGGEKPVFDFSGFRIEYLFYSLIVFLLTLVSRAAVYSAIFKKTMGKFLPGTSFNTAVIGRYYDYITPMGAGGQPFQIWYLAKKKIPGGIAAMLPVVSLIFDHFGFVLVCILAIFLYPAEQLNPVLHIGIYLGMVMFLAIPVLLILFSAFPGPIRFLVQKTIGLLARIRIVSDKDAASAKFIRMLEDYRESMSMIRNSVGTILLGILFSMIQYILLVSFPYLAFCMLGARVDYFLITTITTFVYFAIAAIPTPGNAGAAEGVFYSVLTTLSPSHTFWAMLIWRVFSYYMYLLSGGLFYLFRLLFRKKKTD